MQADQNTMRITIKQIGVGDLVFLAAHVIYNDIAELEINIDRKTVQAYKSQPEQYREFCYTFLERLLYNVKVVRSDIPYEIFYISCANKQIRDYSKYVCPKVVGHFKKTFHADGEPQAGNYICVPTKVRNYNRAQTRQLFEDYAKTLNDINLPVYLIGEKEVEYNRDYLVHGAQRIYSVYDWYRQHLKEDLVHDRTVEKRGVTTPDVDNIFSDLKLMYQSRNIVMIGVGGLFCASLFSEKLMSLCERPDMLQVSGERNKQIFVSYNEFIEKVKSINLKDGPDDSSI